MGIPSISSGTVVSDFFLGVPKSMSVIECMDASDLVGAHRGDLSENPFEAGDSVQAKLNFSTSVMPKSPGKCFKALSTALGINPPRPHREPFNMTSQRSRKRCKFAVRLRF